MKTLYENPWFRVVADNGYHWIEEDGASQGAAVLAIVDQHEALLVEVCRPAQGNRPALEIPRGYAEPGESSIVCACRELLEETGYRATPAQLTRLGRYRPNSAILSSGVDLYLARLTSQDAVGSHDHEVQAVHRVAIEQLLERLLQGELEDGFTLAALAYWQARQQPV